MQSLKYILLSLMFVLPIGGCEKEAVMSDHGQIVSHDADKAEEKVCSAESDDDSEGEIVNVAEPAGDLRLGDVLTLTVMGNPELKVFSLETRSAEARQLQAGLWPNPELDIEIENVGGTGGLSGFEGAETTIQLSQLIEIGDKAGKRRKVASVEKELAGLEYQGKRLEVFAEAAKGFILVLKAQDKLELSGELLELSEKSFAAVEGRVNAGKDSPVEKIRAGVALSNIKILHRESERELEYARKGLAYFWGQDEPMFERAVGRLDSVVELPRSEELKERLKSTPEYEKWEAQIRRSKAALDLEKTNAISDVTFGAGVKRFNETDDNAFILGFSIPLPISDRNQGGKQEAIYNLAKSRHEQRAAWLKLQNEFDQTYLEFANSYEQATSLKNEVLPGAVEMFAAATRAYQEGKVDYLNVLDAQRTLFDVKHEYIESLAAYHIAKTEIERFIGSRGQIRNTSGSEE